MMLLRFFLRWGLLAYLTAIFFCAIPSKTGGTIKTPAEIIALLKAVSPIALFAASFDFPKTFPLALSTTSIPFFNSCDLIAKIFIVLATKTAGKAANVSILNFLAGDHDCREAMYLPTPMRTEIAPAQAPTYEYIKSLVSVGLVL